MLAVRECQATVRFRFSEVLGFLSLAGSQHWYSEVPGNLGRRHFALEIRDGDLQDPLGR